MMCFLKMLLLVLSAILYKTDDDFVVFAVVIFDMYIFEAYKIYILLDIL